jgi:hypothetical protein
MNTWTLAATGETSPPRTIIGAAADAPTARTAALRAVGNLNARNAQHTVYTVCVDGDLIAQLHTGTDAHGRPDRRGLAELLNRISAADTFPR